MRFGVYSRAIELTPGVAIPGSLPTFDSLQGEDIRVFESGVAAVHFMVSVRNQRQASKLTAH